MKTFATLLVATLFAAKALAQAQNPTTTSAGATGIPTGIDSCIENCLENSLSAGGCASIEDFTCLCSSNAFKSAAAACLASACTPADQTAAASLQSVECAGITTSPGESGTTTATSGTASPTSTVTSASATTTVTSGITSTATSPATSSSGGTGSSGSGSGSSTASGSTTTNTSGAVPAILMVGGGYGLTLVVGLVGAVVGAVFVL